MTSLVALSFGPAVPDTARREVLTAAARALGDISGEPACALPTTDGEHVVVSGRRARLPCADRFVVALSQRSAADDGCHLEGDPLLRTLTRGTAHLARFAPPFAACWRAGPAQPIVAATDACGQRHLYWWQGDGWAALSTSSLVLGRVTGAALDEAAVGVLALVGYHVGTQSWFRGVQKLGPGELCRLRSGQVEVQAYAQRPDEVLESYRSFPIAVETGRSVLTGVVRATLDANPDAAMELSGGIDSRGVLAAIPPSRRAGMAAFTLGQRGSADVRVARQIAERWQMDHRVVDIGGLADLGIADAAALVERTGRRQDFCGRDPIASAVLQWVEDQLDQGPRFTGLNGEFARGLFYPGQRAHPRASAPLVDRLATWRLFLNNAVDRSILAPGFLDEARADALRTLRDTIATYEGDWLRACDELYLEVRIQRWAGPGQTASCVARPVLAPYFHAEFLEWARRSSPPWKRRNRLFAATIGGLDDDLARLPLDSGVTPRDLAHGGLAGQVRAAGDLRRKAARKVRQRLTRQTKVEVGASVLTGQVAKGWAATDGALDPIARLPFIQANAVQEIAAGRRPIDPATAGFLTGLRGTVAFAAG